METRGFHKPWDMSLAEHSPPHAHTLAGGTHTSLPPCWTRLRAHAALSSLDVLLLAEIAAGFLIFF